MHVCPQPDRKGAPALSFRQNTHPSRDTMPVSSSRRLSGLSGGFGFGTDGCSQCWIQNGLLLLLLLGFPSSPAAPPLLCWGGQELLGVCRQLQISCCIPPAHSGPHRKQLVISLWSQQHVRACPRNNGGVYRRWKGSVSERRAKQECRGHGTPSTLIPDSWRAALVPLSLWITCVSSCLCPDLSWKVLSTR